MLTTPFATGGIAAYNEVMTAAKNRQLQKVELLGRLLDERLKVSKSGAEYFSFDEVKRYPLFDGPAGFELLLEDIAEYTNNRIRCKIAMQQIVVIPEDSTSNTSTDTRPRFGPEVPIGVNVFVSDPTELRKYIDLASTKAGKAKFSKNKIQSIEVVFSKEEPKPTIVVNEKVECSFRVSPAKKYWAKLIEVAKEGFAYSDGPKKVADYFNTAISCPLYTQKGTKYDLTEVLIVDGEQLRAAPGVIIKSKTEKTLTRRRNISLK